MSDHERASLLYHLLDAWMKLMSRLVPRSERDRWVAEWDGELWYGVAAGRGSARRKAVVGLVHGLASDALHVRRSHAPGSPFANIAADARYGLRMLRKAPGFAAIAVVTLGMGIGGATTILTVVDGVLLSPLPYPDADRMVILWMGRHGAGVERDWLSLGQLSDIRSQTTSFESLAFVSASTATLTGHGEPSRVGRLEAPSSYLELLGARAAIGRTFDSGDDQPSADRVVLLTHGFWTRVLGGDSSVVGRTLTLDGTQTEIVGVLSPDVLLDSEVVPTAESPGAIDVVWSFPTSAEDLSDRIIEWYNVVGRLRPGVSLRTAQAELDLVAARIQETHEADPQSGFFIQAVPLLDDVVGEARPGLTVLLAAVVAVLLIACINVANMLLARSGERSREVGVRVAIGAGRRRIVQQLMMESLMLALLAGGLGAGLAHAGLAAIRRWGTASVPRLSNVDVDLGVLGVSLATALVTCVVFGLVPALSASRAGMEGIAQRSPRGVGARGTSWRRPSLSNGLVVGQIAISIALVVVGGLLAQSFVALRGVDPGFRVEGLLTFRVHLGGPAYADRGDRVAFFDDLLRGLEADPAIDGVAASRTLPFTGSISWAPVEIANYVPPQGPDHQIVAEYRTVTPDFFEVMGVPLLQGRAFDSRDVLGGDDVAIIDEAFAATYFPGRDPIGMSLVSWREAPTIVGVVGSVKHATLDETPRVTVYQPHRQRAPRSMTIVAASRGDGSLAASSVVNAVGRLDPEVPVTEVTSMEQLVADSLAERRFAQGLLQVLAGISVLLAVVGVYGVVSYQVSAGADELGVRIAFGAARSDIARLVIGHGFALALAGAVAGSIAAVLFAGAVRSMLYGVRAFDATTLAAAPCALIVTTMIGCLVPMWRAMRADPLETIRG